MTKEQFQNAVWELNGSAAVAKAWKLYKQSQRALWMARALRAEDKIYNATEEILRYRAEHPNTKLYPSTVFMPAEIAEWIERWQWAERKCREKAEEFE